MSTPEAPPPDFDEVVDQIRARDGAYDALAYQFVRDALDETVGRLPARRHVTGPEILGGARRLALERFGPMARTVLNHWGLQDGRDIGRIVFQLIEAGVLSKTDEDSLDDFTGVMKFDAGLESEYRWPGGGKEERESS